MVLAFINNKRKNSSNDTKLQLNETQNSIIQCDPMRYDMVYMGC